MTRTRWQSLDPKAHPICTLSSADATQENAAGGSWGTDGNIYFSVGGGGGLKKVSADGGEPEILAKPDEAKGEFIYAQPFPEPGPRVQISTDRGTSPVWARSGRELFYRQEDKMMAVDIATEPGLRPGAPRTLFEISYGRPGPGEKGAFYDVAPDRQRFIMIEQPEVQAFTQIHLVFNWLEELERRAPSD